MRRLGPHDDAGFTLIELLVTMSIAMIVLFAVLQGADVFARGAKVGNDRAQAQDTARTTVRQVVQTLRQARLPAGQSTPVATATSPSRQDLTVGAWVTGAGNPAPGSAPGWLRYCVTSDGRSLLVGVLSGAAYAPSGACAANNTSNGWSYSTLVDGVLRDGAQTFDLSSGACSGGLLTGSSNAMSCTPGPASITTVGIRIAIAPTLDAMTPTSVVRDAANLRNGT